MLNIANPSPVSKVPLGHAPQVLFSSEKISDFGTVAFLFLFDKYYPIMD